jgi:predicted dehydrogenase
MEVKVILVGNGYFGSLYRERIMRHKDYALVGVVDPDYDKLRDLRNMTVADSYDTIAQSIDHDAVVICTTPQHHAKLSIEAMNRGKDVLCMKPGAMSLTEHNNIYEASVDNDVAWMIDYTQLAAPEMDFLDSMVLSLGSVENMSLSRHVVTEPKAEGVILDLLPHDVATVNSFFYCDDMSITCTIEGVKATATIRDNKTDKQIAFLSASYNAIYPQKYALLRVQPLASLIANPRIELAWEQNQKFVEVRTQGRSVEVHFRHEPDMITQTLGSFVTYCTHGIRNPSTSLKIMRMLHAMQHSASMSGTPVNYREQEA